jgi:hypothetical protein
LAGQRIDLYWASVKDARAMLAIQDGTDAPATARWMCSIADDTGGRAGVISYMDLEAAARAVALGRARLATDDEIKTAAAETAAARNEIQRLESARLRSDLFAPRFVDPGTQTPTGPATTQTAPPKK